MSIRVSHVAARVLALVRRDVREPEGELEVPSQRQPGEQGRLLEEHRAVGAWAGHRPAVHEHLAARRALETRDDAQDRGLPAPARSDQADELASLDIEGEVLEGGDTLAGRAASSSS